VNSFWSLTICVRSKVSLEMPLSCVEDDDMTVDCTDEAIHRPEVLIR
jgi:hypothetical protein